MPLHVLTIRAIARRDTCLLSVNMKRHPSIDKKHATAFRQLSRKSSQHVNNAHKVVTALELLDASFVSYPSPDGGLDALRHFFSRSDTTLTRVTLVCCDFWNKQEATLLLAAFHTNRTVTHVTIDDIANLEGGALGASLCGLVQNMPQLQRFDCRDCVLRVEGVRALQPALRSNRT
jgi:hypothetical protein